MKRSFAVAALAALASSALPVAGAQAQGADCFEEQTASCTDGKGHALPTSVAEFIELRDKISKDPWGGATMFAYALMVWEKDRALGDKLLVLATSERRLSSGNTFKGYALGRTGAYLMNQAKKAPHCARSYAAGATPKNGYKVPEGTVGVRFRYQKKHVGSIASGRYKVFVCSSGAPSCRPMTLRRNKNGIWKADEFSTLVVGCQAPASNKPTAADKL